MFTLYYVAKVPLKAVSQKRHVANLFSSDMGRDPTTDAGKVLSNFSNLRKWKLESKIKFIQDSQKHIHNACKHLIIKPFAKIVIG